MSDVFSCSCAPNGGQQTDGVIRWRTRGLSSMHSVNIRMRNWRVLDVGSAVAINTSYLGEHPNKNATESILAKPTKLGSYGYLFD
jgi:hypothetical protein